MIGGTLFRYFLRRYLVTMALFLGGIYLLIFVIDATEFSRRFSSLPKYDALVALAVSAVKVPFILQLVMPFIALFAAISTLFQLNRKLELVVARSAGISAWQFLAPLCAGALLLGIFNVAVLNPLAAKGLAYAEAVEADWRSGRRNTVGVRNIPWLRQLTEEGESIIGGKSALQNGKLLRDVIMIRFDADGSITERLDADSARLNEDGFWTLQQVTRHRQGFPPQKMAQVRVPTNLSEELLSERLAMPEAIPFYDLPAQASASQSIGLPGGQFLMQFHWLLASPGMLIGMTLIAATVSMKFVRFGQSFTMILGGIAAGFLLYVVSVLVKAFGEAAIVPPWFAAWLPVILALTYGTAFLLFKEDG